MLTITQAGLAAITTAAEGGFKVNIASFKLSEFNTSAFLNTDFVSATNLFGTPVFSDVVALTEVVSVSTIRVTLSIPKELPRSGSWYFREIGLYLDTGELFAIGALDPAYEKNNLYGIKIYVLATANRLSEAITVTVNQNNSLPTVAQVRLLPQPVKSEHSVVIVLDEVSCQYADSYAAGLAVKSGPGLLHWSFIGHNRIYYGNADAILDPATFVVSSAVGGFWLNDAEIVIGQITTGSGAGQARRLRYTKANESFTSTDTQFADLNQTSVIAIWRDNANQLPTRKASIPDYMVLSHGLRSWQRVDAVPATFSTYQAQTVTSTLNSDSQFGHTMIEPPSADRVTFVWVNGQCIPEGQYSLSWNVITVFGKPAGAQIDLMVLKRVDTSVGGILSAFEANHIADGLSTRFFFSLVPKSVDWIAVYVDGVYMHQSAYQFEDTSLVFSVAPVAGAKILIVQLCLYDDVSGSSNVMRTFRQLVPGDVEITLTDAPSAQSQVLLFIDGKQYNHKDYEITPTGLRINTPPNFPGGSSYVDLTLFIPTVTSSLLYVPESVSGTDTGPKWIDPAGSEGPANKLVPITNSIISDGSQVDFTVQPVIDANYVLVFVGGAFRQPETYVYANSRVVFNEPVASGTLIDIICFTEVTIDDGFQVACTSFSVMSSSDLIYQLAPVTRIDSIIVTVNGVYQHKLSYSVDPNHILYFQSVGAGLPIEVWYFNVVPSAGLRTTMKYDKSGGNAANSYPLSQNVSIKHNVLSFVGDKKYENTKYSVNAVGNRVALAPNATTDVPVVGVSFVSEMPKTRLLTRAEYNNSIVSFNYRTGAVLLTREDVAAVLHREDVFALLTQAERDILNGLGGGGGGPVDPPPTPHAEPGNVFIAENWTVPAGVYHIKVVIIGGGGQGGGASNGLLYAGSGGRRGGVTVQEMDVVPGQQIEVLIGVGGSSYLYTMAGATVYPRPGDFGTTDGNQAFQGRNGEASTFYVWTAPGGQGGPSFPAAGPDYVQNNAAGEGQVPMATGVGAYTGGGLPGVTGVETPGNNVMSFSDGGPDSAFGYAQPNSTGGGYPATVPGAGGGGAAADPAGVGAFGGPGTNGVIYISWV